MTYRDKSLLVWAALAVVCVVGIFVVAVVVAANSGGITEVLSSVGIAVTAILTFFATRIGALFTTTKIVEEPEPEPEPEEIDE